MITEYCFLSFFKTVSLQSLFMLSLGRKASTQKQKTSSKLPLENLRSLNAYSTASVVPAILQTQLFQSCLNTQWWVIFKLIFFFTSSLKIYLYPSLKYRKEDCSVFQVLSLIQWNLMIRNCLKCYEPLI